MGYVHNKFDEANLGQVIEQTKIFCCHFELDFWHTELKIKRGHLLAMVSLRIADLIYIICMTKQTDVQAENHLLRSKLNIKKVKTINTFLRLVFQHFVLEEL
jgi:hypothetical protein